MDKEIAHFVDSNGHPSVTVTTDGEFSAAQAAASAGLKAPEERWTTKLGLEPDMISYESMISPEFFALEREAIFRRSWLYVGRADALEGPRTYFTREIDILSTSVIVVRGLDGTIRAFHNSCPHRGNRLVWQDEPTRPVSGRCAMFVCKYHGLGFALDGTLARLTAPTNWMEGQEKHLRLAEVACDVVNGFIFVNFDRDGPRKSLKEYLGAYFCDRLENYPYEKLTGHISLTGTAKSNWKALQDAFSEGFHVTSLHKWTFPQYVADDPAVDSTSRATAYIVDDPHRSIFMGGFPPPEPYFPIERFGKGNATGPKIGAFSEDLTKLPPSMNPLGDDQWFHLTSALFPNLIIQHFEPGWYGTFQFVPLAHDAMRFDIDLYFPEPRNFSDVLAHHTALSFMYDAFLQDFSTLEATQRGLAARAFVSYPLIDEEFQVRHFHKMVHDAVDAYKREKGLP